jgi:putative transposase
MTNYRRNAIAGGRFFFTVNLAERRLRLFTDHIDLLRGAFRETRHRHPFAIDAIVVLPDHGRLGAMGFARAHPTYTCCFTFAGS